MVRIHGSRLASLIVICNNRPAKLFLIFMYYTHPCSYCTKVFYTYHNNREYASRALYYGIKKHLVDYDEDHKEYQFDDGPQVDSNEVYAAMIEFTYIPPGAYPV